VWIYRLLAIILLLVPIVIPIFSYLSRRASRTQPPREEGAVVEFFVTPSMRFLINLVLTLLLAFTVFVGIASRVAGGTPLVVLIPLSVLALILLAKPVPVTVDHEGIRQNAWLREARRIAWEDVSSVELGPNTGTLYVRSRRGGSKIRFSPHLVGQKQFLGQLRMQARNAEILLDDGSANDG
jgi:hypothetical protein